MPPFDTVDWDADRDWEWHTAKDDTPEELFALFDEAVRRSDAVLDRGAVARRRRASTASRSQRPPTVAAGSACAGSSST